MYYSIKHACGGRAHLIGGQLVYGWNFYCCGRCAETFYRWVTDKMLEQEHTAK